MALSASAGFAEELAYRGYLQRQLAAISQSQIVAVLGQGVVFGLAHLFQGLPSVLLITTLGMALGILAAWRRNLRPSIAAHMCGDLVAGLVLLR